MKMRTILPITLLALMSAAPSTAQTTGTYVPAIPSQYLNNNGDPCSACKLYSYEAGTDTPLSTYSNVGLTIANANPIVLDSAGRATIFLTAASYKFVLKSAADAEIWSRDSVAAIPFTTIASSFNSTCDLRLSLATGTPVTTTDQTAATTIFVVPYRGNRCALYDGAQWNINAITELSIALGADAADTNWDLFLYLSAGTPTLERLAWTNATTRATALVQQDGVLVQSGATTRRYLGTYRTTGTIGQTEDSAAKRFVWNYYNRIMRSLRVTEATNSWTYTTAVFRQANASTANQVAVVVGVAEVPVDLRVLGMASNAVGASVFVGIGEDSTTAAVAGCLMQIASASSSLVVPVTASVVRYPPIGYHYYTWLEGSGAAGTTTWNGDGGDPSLIQAGLTGQIGG